MDLDFGTIAVAFLISGIGYVLFRYGRSMSRSPHVLVGLVLMVFPYFVSTPWLAGLIAAALCAGLYGAVRLGW